MTTTRTPGIRQAPVGPHLDPADRPDPADVAEQRRRAKPPRRPGRKTAASISPKEQTK